MFQTEINAWLQSFSSPWLDSIMRSISFLGNGEFIAALLIIVIFGYRFRLGVTVLLAVLLGSAVTNTLKNVFEYPRPVFLSEAVGEPGDATPPPTMYEGGGGSTFWSLPKAEAIETMRELHRIHDEGADGLPSGHVTSATTLALGLALLLGGLRFLPVAIGWVLLMALSRMYLGRHFLADVLMGAGIGILCLSVTLFITQAFRARNDSKAGFWFAVVGFAAAIAALLPVAEQDNLGELAGLSVGILVILAFGVPDDQAPVIKRLARVILGGAIYIATSIVFKALDVEELPGGEFWQSLGLIAITSAATVLIGKQIRLFQTH